MPVPAAPAVPPTRTHCGGLPVQKSSLGCTQLGDYHGRTGQSAQSGYTGFPQTDWLKPRLGGATCNQPTKRRYLGSISSHRELLDLHKSAQPHESVNQKQELGSLHRSKTSSTEDAIRSRESTVGPYVGIRVSGWRGAEAGLGVMMSEHERTLNVQTASKKRTLQQILSLLGPPDYGTSTPRVHSQDTCPEISRPPTSTISSSLSFSRPLCPAPRQSFGSTPGLSEGLDMLLPPTTLGKRNRVS